MQDTTDPQESMSIHMSQESDPYFHSNHISTGNHVNDHGHQIDENMDIDPLHEPLASASPIDATVSSLQQPSSQEWTFAETPVKRRGRKPKILPEEDKDTTGTNLDKDKKLRGSKIAKPLKETKEKKVREPKLPKESKTPKEPKVPKEPKQKKPKKSENNDNGANSGTKPERSILSFFDRSNVGSITKISTGITGEHQRGDSSSIQSSAMQPGFKQSCLSFDIFDPSKAGSYVDMTAPMEEKRFGGIMKELPRLTGRAPYEDLMSGLLLRSSKLPTLNKLDLHHPELNMDMLADVKMIHEFLNTFGTPLGLTKDSGEWITFDLLLSMIRNPRIDNRLVDLSCKMVMAAYEEGESPEITQFNFPFFLATGPETVVARRVRKDVKKNKWGAISAPKKKIPPMNRLGTIEYSVYTIADRIEALVKALHDITSSPRFHRFMRDEVEENITSLKRHKRKRTEARKELDTLIQGLERDIKAIEFEEAELEKQRQAILDSEREIAQIEDENGRTMSRQQRLAQAKDARNKVNDLSNKKKALAHERKIKEELCETKKMELNDVVMDDSEIQKDHNVPLTQLRGGHVVNTDENLRVVCLGNDRWGRKYWFWREFGGVIIEDREQIGPDFSKISRLTTSSTETATLITTLSNESEDGRAAIADDSSAKVQIDVNTDETIRDVTQRMMTMAEPDLAGAKFRSNRNTMSIDSLLTESQASEAVNQSDFAQPPAVPASLPRVMAQPEKDPLDYGPIQTWSLISTSKELASVTRALNGKGLRERVLKASLVTMRKEIEASFDLIRTWAGHEYAGKKEQLVSVLGAVGQPLSEEDLMLLLKKRGRKSRQELADIAATRYELATSGAEERVMEVDGDLGTIDESLSRVDVDITEDSSEKTDHESTGNGDHEDKNEIDDETGKGFLAIVAPSDAGPTTAKYFEDIVRIADEKIRELSGMICSGDKEAILKAVQDLESSMKDDRDNRVPSIVKVLEHCLQAMDVLEDANEEGSLEGEEEKANSAEMDIKDVSMEQDDSKTLPIATTATLFEKEAEKTCQFSINIPENPGLLNWLKNYHIDTMLKNVQTYGALHAWIEACIHLIANVVYDTEENEEDEEDLHRRGEKDNEADDGDDNDREGDDEDDEDDEEHDHDEDERDETGNYKGDDDGRQEDEDDGDSENRRSRQRKPSQQKSTLKLMEGRTLRSRTRVSYAYTVVDEEESVESESQDDDGVEESEDEAPLRRSKRIRH
ncbi:hypothetical protein FBU30_004858 [Linnemannia zychae]|nr:hypothetical protein FBU30_004858 [Linnemannia zychae]